MKYTLDRRDYYNDIFDTYGHFSPVRFTLKKAVISGIYCFSIIKYLKTTRRFILSGYELIKV